MNHKTLAEHSRSKWTATDNQPDLDQLKFGCLQRIAESLEKISISIAENKVITEHNATLLKENQKLANKVSALRRQLKG